MSDRADPVADRFQREFGRRPTGVWMAPGRVNLIGDHTDYNAGLVLPFALAEGAYVALAPADGQSRIRSAQQPGGGAAFLAAEIGPGDVSGWAGYLAGVFWALSGAGHPVPDCDLLVDSTVPVGSGLSSSAALECATVTALADLAGLELDRTELALIAQRAENDFVGAPTGVMDQMASMHGADGQLVLIDTRSLAVEHIPLPLAGAGLELMVIDSHTPHALVDGQYAARRSACAAAAAELGVPALRDLGIADLPAALDRLPAEAGRRVRHVVTEIDRVAQTVALLRSGTDPRAIGGLLTESHRSLRDDYEVSAAQVDVAVAAALATGAHGARITGGGFGGSAIALVEAGAAPAIFTAVARSYDQHNFAPPSYFLARPSGGASRLR